MNQSRTTETVEEYLARGGRVQEIPKGKSGEWSGRFNGTLKERMRAMNEATWRARKDLHNKK